MNEADLILLILDASRPITREEEDLLEEARRNKTIVIWNKIDQKISQPELTAPYIVEISALHKIGIDELVKSIDSLIWKEGPPSKEEIVITSVRHKEALLLAQGSFKRAAEGLKSGVSPEFVAFDMREGLTSLGQIIGANITEDILSAIFNKFCIGK
jgi:tRNA modification GTPase